MLAENVVHSSNNDRVPYYTVAQASVLTGVPVKAINQYLDRELKSIIVIGPGVRGVKSDALVGLALNHDLVKNLALEPRVAVLGSVLNCSRTKSITVPGSCIRVCTVHARSRVAQGLSNWRKAKELVAECDEVLAGEPCLKGTRLSVYVVAELCREFGIEEVQATYPGVSVAQVDAALMFARMFPKRGRPRSVGARLDKAKPTKSRRRRVQLPA